MMLPDLDTLQASLRAGTTSRTAIVEAAQAAAAGPAARSVFLQTSFDEALRVARAADAAALAGQPLHPLAGLPVSIKDLFDIAGEVTRAAAIARDDAAPADADAAVVARLRHAGAALVGRTNMSEFAFSGVGINPISVPRAIRSTPPSRAFPAGPPRVPPSRWRWGWQSPGSAAIPGLDPHPGGTVRSHRLQADHPPRPAHRRLSLSYTLDTACAMTRSVSGCVLVDSVLADTPAMPIGKAPAAIRPAVARQYLQDDTEPVVAQAFDRALGRLSAAGVRIEHIELPELEELPGLNAAGGFTAAEALVDPSPPAGHPACPVRSARGHAHRARRRHERCRLRRPDARPHGLDRPRAGAAGRRLRRHRLSDRADGGATAGSAARRRCAVLPHQRPAAAQHLRLQLLDGCSISCPATRPANCRSA